MIAAAVRGERPIPGIAPHAFGDGPRRELQTSGGPVGVLRLVERLLLRGLVRLAVAGPLGEERGQQVDGLDAARGEVGEQLPLERVCDLTDETRERRAVAARRRGRALRKDLRLRRDGHEQQVDAVLREQVLEADDRRDRVLVSALLAQIAAQHIGERPRVEQEPVAARQRLGTGRDGAEPRLERAVQGRDLLRPRGPRAAVRRELRAHRPCHRRGVRRGNAARKRGRRLSRRRRRRRRPGAAVWSTAKTL